MFIGIKRLGVVTIGGKPYVAPVLTSWNPSDKAANVTLSGGNLVATNSAAAAWAAVRGTVSKAAGKWYYEIALNAGRTTAGSTVDAIMGIARSTHSLTAYTGQGGAFGYGVQNNSAGTTLAFAPSALPAYAAHAGQLVFGIALDLDAGTLKYSFNGVDKGTANTGITGTYFPCVWLYMQNPTHTTATARFDPASWSYPSTYPGYSAWA